MWNIVQPTVSYVNNILRIILFALLNYILRMV